MLVGEGVLDSLLEAAKLLERLPPRLRLRFDDTFELMQIDTLGLSEQYQHS